MDKAEFLYETRKIIENMINEEVIHSSMGKGTVKSVSYDKCKVKYDADSCERTMSIENFFRFNEPIKPNFMDDYNALKCDYDLSLKQAKIIKKNCEKEGNIKPYDPTDNLDLRITFDDVIGLENVKELIYQMVIYPFEYKDIYKAFKRGAGGGILLYGPPGTGKTMIAKAIGNEINAKFFSVKCSDIATKWYGESERKIKELFDAARSCDKAIIFFDEFDSLGINRDDNESHASSMVVSELLSQIDGFDEKENAILLIASTNKPWNIDSALLRSGRFNKKIYIDLPNNISRCNLLIHEFLDIPTSNVKIDEISKLTDGYSSADIVELCNESKDIAIKRSIKMNEISQITQEDVIDALSRVKSTVVPEELNRLANYSL